MATGAQKHLIHGLIEQSSERVVQVRAGQSLVNVLLEDQSQQHISSPQHHHPHQQQQHKKSHNHNAKKGDNTSRNTLPGIPTMKLVYEARRHADAASKSNSGAQSDASAMRKNLRKRGILAASSPNNTDIINPTSTALSTSHDCRHDFTVTDRAPTVAFLQYVNSKSAQVETLHQNDRRKAITRSTWKMAQLAGIAESKALSSQQSALPESEPAKALFARTLAVIKGKNALLKLRETSHEGFPSSLASVPDAQELLRVKNAHFAFLDFRKDGNSEDARHKPK